MTLIAAFRAPKHPNGPDGIAVCADSQETITKYDDNMQPYELKVAVQKIEPIYASDAVHVAIAGAGNATLIEGFIEKARREFGKGSDPASISDLRDLLEKRLKHFYRNEVANCPDDDRRFALFILASCPQAKEYELWLSEYQVLKAVKFPALVGEVEALYKKTAERFSRPDLTLSQAVLASIYTVTVAKQTSNYVGGDLTVAIVRSNGIWIDKQEYVNEMEERLKIYESTLNQLFLSCADTSISTPALIKSMQQFSTEAAKLHHEQIVSQVRDLTLKEIAQTNDPYPKYPLGSNVVFSPEGKFIDMRPPEQHEEMNVYARKANEHFGAMGLVEYVIRSESGGKYSVSLSGRWDGKQNQLIGLLTKDELIVAMSEVKPFPPEDMLAYLQIEGSEFFCYAPPITLSDSQKLGDHL